MAKIEASTEIAAPPKAVYDYFDDHNNTADYFPQMSDLEWSTPLHEVGTRLKMVNKSAGVPVTIVAETKEVEPGRRVAGVFSEGLKGTWEWLFSPAGAGTRVETKMDYEMPMGILGQFADRLVFERGNQADMERSLAIVKQRTETR